MKKKTLAIGIVAVTALAVGGWALAESVGPRGGFGPAFMRGDGHGGMGRMKGVHGRGHDSMGQGMMKGMGGHGPGMMIGKGSGVRGPEGAPDRD